MTSYYVKIVVSIILLVGVTVTPILVFEYHKPIFILLGGTIVGVGGALIADRHIHKCKKCYSWLTIEKRFNLDEGNGICCEGEKCLCLVCGNSERIWSHRFLKSSIPRPFIRKV